MKVLVVQDPSKDEDARDIKRVVEARVRAFRGTFLSAGSLRRALQYLAGKDVDLVVVHHDDDFSDIDKMRQMFSDVKYAGYSANLRISLEYVGNPKSAGAQFIRDFGEHYDYSLYDIGGSLDNVLQEVSEAKK